MPTLRHRLLLLRNDLGSCHLPWPNEVSGIAMVEGGDHARCRGRRGAGHEDPASHRARVEWGHHLGAGGDVKVSMPRHFDGAAIPRHFHVATSILLATLDLARTRD